MFNTFSTNIYFRIFNPVIQVSVVTHAHTNTLNTHLEVKELAVAPVNSFCTAITPGHFDDVNLAKKKREENYITA